MSYHYQSVWNVVLPPPTYKLPSSAGRRHLLFSLAFTHLRILLAFYGCCHVLMPENRRPGNLTHFLLLVFHLYKALIITTHNQQRSLPFTFWSDPQYPNLWLKRDNVSLCFRSFTLLPGVKQLRMQKLFNFVRTWTDRKASAFNRRILPFALPYVSRHSSNKPSPRQFHPTFCQPQALNSEGLPRSTKNTHQLTLLLTESLLNNKKISFLLQQTALVQPQPSATTGESQVGNLANQLTYWNYVYLREDE